MKGGHFAATVGTGGPNRPGRHYNYDLIRPWLKTHSQSQCNGGVAGPMNIFAVVPNCRPLKFFGGVTGVNFFGGVTGAPLLRATRPNSLAPGAVASGLTALPATRPRSAAGAVAAGGRGSEATSRAIDPEGLKAVNCFSGPFKGV